jgi:hypothetical protein
MNKKLIISTFLCCALNGQFSYNEWKEMSAHVPMHAMLYLSSNINGQGKALNYANNRMDQLNRILSPNSSPVSKAAQELINGAFAMMPKDALVADMTKETIEWIEERPWLWNLQMDDLCLYARLDVYGDMTTKIWVDQLIKKPPR